MYILYVILLSFEVYSIAEIGLIWFLISWVMYTVVLLPLDMYVNM